MKAAHDNGADRTYKTLFKILGRTLYERGLPVDQQAMIDEAQAKGDIYYLQVDDPVTAVRDIVNVVAVDPPIAVVTRLVNSFQKVTSCHRNKGEDFRVSASRFRGLAAKPLLLVNAHSSSQIGEVLAVTELNNADLDGTTLITATTNLIARAEAKPEMQKEKESVEVPKKTLDNLYNVTAQLESIRNYSVPQEPAAMNNFLQNFRSKCSEGIQQLAKVVEDVKNPPPVDALSNSISNLFVSDQEPVRLSLDDSITVIRNLSQARSASESRLKEKEISELVNRKFDALLASYNLGHSNPQGGSHKGSNRRGPGPSGSGGPDQSGRNGRGDGNGDHGKKRRRDSDDLCFDCGEKCHRRGSSDCKNPSYLTIKRRKRMSGSPSNQESGKTQSGSSFFRKLSGADSSN